MIRLKQYDAPLFRVVPVHLEQLFCDSGSDSFSGSAEGVDYDNWLDGLE